MFRPSPEKSSRPHGENPLRRCLNAFWGQVMSWAPIIQAAAAATFVILHTVIAALFILCMYGLESLIRFLWQVQEPVLFGRLPLTYMFEAIDPGGLAMFGYRGIQAAYEAFEE